MDDTTTIEPAAVGLGHNQPDLAVALREDHADLIRRRDELHDAVGRVPETIEDEETAGRVADFIKQIQAAIKNANAKRVDTKEPFLEGGRLVDGFFKGITDPLGVDKKAVEKPLTVYQQKKAAEEQRRRDEEALRARDEAERQAREAAEAAAALETEDQLDGAVAAEDAAKQAEEAARKAQREAAAKAADMSRNRGDHGGVASLRTYWTFEVEDIHEVDLETIRAHLPISAVEQAIRSYVKAGGRELRGVRIFEETQTVVR